MDEMTRRMEGHAPEWDGTFHGLLYSIPERHRAYRDALRRFATLAGFGLLRPGLLVSPWPGPWPLTSFLERAPTGSHILQLQLQVPRDQARDVAAEAWELPTLATRYRRKIAMLDRTTERMTSRPPGGRLALRTFATTVETVFETVVVDPGLPAELLPEDWPQPRLVDAMERFYPAVGRLAIERLRELLPEIEIPDPTTVRRAAALSVRLRRDSPLVAVSVSPLSEDNDDGA
jgi:phenylacetic acid degradation operon negative regulatory protein